MAKLVRQLLDRAASRQFLDAVTHTGPSYQPTPLPRRGDHVEAWLKQQRDACFGHAATYNAVDGLLDDYRLHADTGTPLDQHCCEGGNVDDCAGCHDAAQLHARLGAALKEAIPDSEIEARLAATRHGHQGEQR